MKGYPVNRFTSWYRIIYGIPKMMINLTMIAGKSCSLHGILPRKYATTMWEIPTYFRSSACTVQYVSTSQRRDCSRGSRRFCRWNWPATWRKLLPPLLQELEERRAMLLDGWGPKQTPPPDLPRRWPALAGLLPSLWGFSVRCCMTCTALRVGGTCETIAMKMVR